MTPGVQLPPASSSSSSSSGKIGGDNLGQQYHTPEHVILQQGSDLIIVGRAIIQAKDVQAEAQRYQHEGWQAYQKSINI